MQISRPQVKPYNRLTILYNLSGAVRAWFGFKFDKEYYSFNIMRPLFVMNPGRNYTLLYQFHGKPFEHKSSNRAYRADKIRRTWALSMQNLTLEHSGKFKKHKFDRFGDISGKECVVSHWGPWTPCTTTCDPGQRKRFRVILEYGIYGVNCPNLDQTTLCNLGKCQNNVEKTTQKNDWSIQMGFP